MAETEGLKGISIGSGSGLSQGIQYSFQCGDRFVLTLISRFKWMLVTLILPEFILGKALSDFIAAVESVRRVRTMRDIHGNSLPTEEVANWTKTHAYYGDMGGFVFRTQQMRPDGQGYALQHMVSEEILHLRRTGQLSTLPQIPKDMINAMSKGDIFVKMTAVFQASWMVLQVIIRRGVNLPISQLEITACSFAATTIVTYALCWTKPQAVDIATEVKLAHTESTELLFTRRLPGFWRYRLGRYDKDHMTARYAPDKPVWNDSVPVRIMNTIPVSSFTILDIGVIVGSVVLGSVHCAAWNFQFPTKIEQWLWRYSSVTQIVIIPLYFLVTWIMECIESTICCDKFVIQQNEVKIQAGILGFSTGIIYVLCRLYILFETVYSLFYLPPDAFFITWSSVIPHVS